jgi:probable F420-dependent oxidoreductase
VQFGITLGQLNPSAFVDATVAADQLGYESVWMAEHLVLPMRIEGQLVPGEDHPPVPPTVPVYDAPAYLAHLAALTSRIRLGTFVYLLGIRHPFVGARAFATLDVVSGGRAVCGVGAGWLRTEWEAAGLDPRTRGRRLDETIEVCRRLWAEPVVEHHGEHLDFEPVAFEPKPVQQPLPVHVGGESDAALARAGRAGDGWLGMQHAPSSAAAQVERLRRHVDAAGRDPAEVEVTVMAEARGDEVPDVDAYERAGVDRLIVVPWLRTRDAVAGMERLAAEVLG